MEKSSKINQFINFIAWLTSVCVLCHVPFKFKVKIVRFDLLDLGAHSLKHPLDCNKREKK